MSRHEHGREGMNWLGLLSFGFFLALLGTIWAAHPNFTEKVINFFRDFHLESVSGNVVFPAPRNLYSHIEVYTAAIQFCYAFGLFNIAILVLRFLLRDSPGRKAETFSGVVFWFAVGYFLNMLASGSLTWFSFLGGLIVSVGLSIVTSSVFRLFT